MDGHMNYLCKLVITSFPGFYTYLPGTKGGTNGKDSFQKDILILVTTWGRERDRQREKERYRDRETEKQRDRETETEEREISREIIKETKGLQIYSSTWGRI